MTETDHSNNEGRISKNISVDSHNDQTFYKGKQKHELVISRCPTAICEQCQRYYRDSLDLGLLVTCGCVCHKGALYNNSRGNGFQ